MVRPVNLYLFARLLHLVVPLLRPHHRQPAQDPSRTVEELQWLLTRLPLLGKLQRTDSISVQRSNYSTARIGATPGATKKSIPTSASLTRQSVDTPPPCWDRSTSQPANNKVFGRQSRSVQPATSDHRERSTIVLSTAKTTEQFTVLLGTPLERSHPSMEGLSESGP